MFYCPHCKKACAFDTCPDCNKKRLKEIENNSPVFLIRTNAFLSGIVEGALHDHGIPFLRQGEKGPALSVTIGTNSENYRFYVPYEALPTAQELLEAILHQ